MEANSIKDKKFTEAMRGYKKEEVDEFLGEVAMEFTQLRNQNSELEKKLGVLADKIREYREDEDALKDALLGAQKQGNAVIANAKERSAELIQEAQNKCDGMISDAINAAEEKRLEMEKMIEDAYAEKKRIEDEATKKAADIHAEMEIQTEIDKEILARTKREAEDFRTRLVVEYTNHMELLKKIPEACENEFVKDTTKNHDTARLRELLDRQNSDTPIMPIAAPAAEKAEKKDDDDIKVVSSFDEIPVSEAESTEIEETADGGAFTVESAFIDDDKDDERDTPDFLKQPQRQNKSKYEKLEFGNNTSGNGKNKKKR